MRTKSRRNCWTRIVIILLTIGVMSVFVPAISEGMQWICPNCGEENSGRFCGNCGFARSDVEWECSVCRTYNLGSYCTNCGSPKDIENNSIISNGYDAILENCFEEGDVSFVRADYAFPDFDTCGLIVPEYFWDYVPDSNPDTSEEGVRQRLKESEILPMTASVDGSHIIAVAVLNGSGYNIPIVIADDQVTVICPTTRRGIEDKYGNMDAIYRECYINYNNALPLNLAKEGALWSPSGRYFCVFNWWRALSGNGLAYNNPVIIDTYTGEMILLYTFEGSYNSIGGYGSVTGCFSKDEKQLYTITNVNESTGVLAHSIETGETETVYLIDDGYFSVPALYQGYNDELLLITDDGFRQSIEIIANGKLISKENMPYDMNKWYIQKCIISDNNEFGLNIIKAFRATALYGISKFDLKENNSTAEMWAISNDLMFLEKIDTDQISELAGGSDTSIMKYSRDYAHIADVVLSPGGEFALIVAGTADANCTIVVRVDDMEWMIADGLQVSAEAFNSLSSGQPGLCWTNAGLMVYNGEQFELWQIVK